VSEYLKAKRVHEYVFTRSCLVEVETVVLVELHFLFLLLEECFLSRVFKAMVLGHLLRLLFQAIRNDVSNALLISSAEASLAILNSFLRVDQ
jgi:hypothetical protein